MSKKKQSKLIQNGSKWLKIVHGNAPRTADCGWSRAEMTTKRPEMARNDSPGGLPEHFQKNAPVQEKSYVSCFSVTAVWCLVQPPSLQLLRPSGRFAGPGGYLAQQPFFFPFWGAQPNSLPACSRRPGLCTATSDSPNFLGGGRCAMAV